MKEIKKILIALFFLLSALKGGIAQPIFSVSCTNFSLLSSEQNTSTNFYIQTHLNGVANSGCDFKITIQKLPVTTPTNVLVKIKEKNEFGGKFVYSGQYTTTANGIVITSNIDPIALNLSGIYQIEVYDASGNLISLILNYYIFFEKVKTITITGASYNFSLHYSDAFFQATTLSKAVNSVNFLTELENAIKASWQKEVIDYNLGRPSTSGNFDIYLHCNHDLAGLAPYFHNSINYPVRTDPSNDNKDIFIDTKIFEELNTTGITQQELIYIIFSHEFWHSIQWSIMSWDNLKAKCKSSGASLTDEKEKRDWLIEGQALFLQTKFMETYSTSSANCNYQRGTANGAYDAYAAIFLNEAFNSTYLFKSLHQQNYFYGLFWRHLYEHNAKSASDADKLKILTASCQQLEAYNTSDLSTANKLMDNALATAAGNFTTFASALKDFAERAYFHDAAYQNWDDPNKNNFYTAISNYTETAEAFNGTLFNKQYKIDNSYAFRSHKIGFSKAGAVNVKFTSIATGGSMANFYAKVYVADNSKIYESREITLPNGTGNAEICVDNAAKKLIVLVTRLDANEGQYPDYKITVTPLNLAFSGTVNTSERFPLDVAFTNTSTSSTMGYIWDFGDGTQSQEVSPTHTYTMSGAFDVKLNYGAGCSASLALVGKAYVSFLPFLKKVEISRKDGLGNKSEFTRTISGNRIGFANTLNTIDNKTDILVKVTASGVLQHLHLTLTDSARNVKFDMNNAAPSASDNKVWEFLIPASSLSEGINLLTFSGADAANNKLIRKHAQWSYPYKIMNGITNKWTTDTINMTGTDVNYHFYIKPSQAVSNDIQIIVDKECQNNAAVVIRKVLFINNSNKKYKIDFGDSAKNANFEPYSVIVNYYYSNTNSNYTVILKTLDRTNTEVTYRHTLNF